jgi:hypothetical protein
MNVTQRNWLIGIGAVSVLTALYIVTKPKGDDDDKEGDQSKPNPALDKLIQTGQTTGISVRSKVSNAKLRTEYKVNDGKINNLYGEVPTFNTEIGVVLDKPYDDQNKQINPATKQVYKWLKVKITQAVYDEIQDNQRGFWTRDKVRKVPFQLFVREDTVKV